MEITAIFKTCVETIRQKNKELALISQEKNSLAKPKIFPGKKSEYFAKARDLSTTITKLKDYLHENRNAYLNIAAVASHNSVFSNDATSKGKIMSDVDRDLLDNDAQKIIHSCQKKISEYQGLIEGTESIKNNKCLATHMESVADSLASYLKQVAAMHSEMRAVRVKKTVDYQNMSRLSSIKLNSKSTAARMDFKKISGRRTSLDLQEEIDGHSPTHSPTIPEYFMEDEEIPPEELQLLEEENAALLDQLNSLAQEVDQVQSSVVQIAQLQEIFTEKVLHQEKEIDHIANVVVGATENIKGGNEQLRQAIQKNADFRVWVLFFILVMSFSLLFLDWYND